MLRSTACLSVLLALLLVPVDAFSAPPGSGRPPIRIFEPFKPNLVVSDLKIEKSGSGAPFMYVTVTNKGLKASGPFQIQDTLTRDGAVVHAWPSTRNETTLFPGQSRVVTYPLYLQVPSSLDAQTWSALVIVNFYKTVSESSYSDNAIFGTFVK